MRKISAAILFLLGLALVTVAVPAKAASSALPAPAQGNCADDNLSKGEGKFTGQISGGPNGSLIEVTSGNETALVHYSKSSIVVCEGGVPVPVNRLATGATVVVYGPMKHKGNVTDINAVKILVAGSPESSTMTGDSMNTNYTGPARGAAQSGNSNTGSGAYQMPNSNAVQTGSVIGSQSHSNSQNSGAIACNALLFGVTNPRDPNGARGTERASASAIICKRPVDQMALQLAQDAMERRNLSLVTLNWQSQLEASLKNAEIMSVQFSSDNGTEIVEITYSCQKAEIVHLPSGTHISF